MDIDPDKVFEPLSWADMPTVGQRKMKLLALKELLKRRDELIDHLSRAYNAGLWEELGGVNRKIQKYVNLGRIYKEQIYNFSHPEEVWKRHDREFEAEEESSQ